MKAFKLNLFSFIAVSLLFGSLQLYAQQESTNDQNNQIVIIKKYTDEDGTTTIEKIVKDGDGINMIDIQGLRDELNESLEDIQIDVDEINGETIIKIENLGEEIQNAIHEGLEDVEWNFDDNDHNHITIKSSCGSKKPFLGVVINNTNGERDGGIRISEVVNNSAAEAAGLEEGDILSAINGKRVDDFEDLSDVLGQFEIDDEVTIDYSRNGQALQTNATLKAKRQNNNHSYNYNYNYNNGSGNHNNFWSNRAGRNACKPFIGVYLGGTRSGGIKVSGVIDGTPAEEVDMERGDIIVAINDVEVSTFGELLAERDKHSAGDYFTLSFLRDGNLTEVEAQFPACDDEETPASERNQAPTIEMPQNFNTAPSRQPSSQVNTLQLQEMRTFPNPTDGDINIQFRGEAVPTVVTITDATGREIMRETMNNFNGTYNEVISLKNDAAPGTLSVTIRQGNQIYSEQIILTNGF